MKSIFQSVAVGLLILVVVIALMNSFANPKVPTSMEHLQNAAGATNGVRCVAVPAGKQVQFIDSAGSVQPDHQSAPATGPPTGAPPETPVSTASELPTSKRKSLEDCYLDCLDLPPAQRANVSQGCRNMQGQPLLDCLNKHGVKITDAIKEKCNYCSKYEEFSNYDPLTLDYAPAMEPEHILCTGNVQGPGPTQHGPGLREGFWCPRREKTFMTESLDPYGYCCGKFYSNMSQGYQQCVASGAGVNPPPPGR